MAYAASELDTIQFGQRKIHLHTSADDLSTVIAADYFISAYERLGVGDIIFSSHQASAASRVGTLVVLTSAVGGVTVTNLSGVAE